MIEQYGLHSEFDIKKHKQKFINYLEVLILEDGKVVYAVPSHQAKAEELCCEKLKLRCHEELLCACPQEYYYDYMTWLLNICGAVLVWNDYCLFGKSGINKKQATTLKRLKLNGLYRGAI